MQQFSAHDASFVYLEPHTRMHIGSAGIYDPMRQRSTNVPGRPGANLLRRRADAGDVRHRAHLDSTGLICPVYSYGGTIAVSFTADRDMMPDPEVFASALRSSFEALRDAVQPRSAPPVEAGEKTKGPAPQPASQGAR